MIKILDSYLIKNFLKHYALSLLVMVSLFLLIDVITTLNRFDVSGNTYLAYYAHYLPWIVSQMMPIAGVMATVFLLVYLQKHHELIVLHSLGVSIYRLLTPVLLCIFLFSVASWVMTDKVVPKAMEKRNYYYYVEMKKSPGSYNKLKRSNIWFRTPEAIVNFGRTLSAHQVKTVKVFFYDHDLWEPTRTLEADLVDLQEDQWIFKSGVETLYDREDGQLAGVHSQAFESLVTKPLEDLSDFKKRQSRTESMTLSELSYAVKKAKASGMSSRVLETEYHGKLSFIFSALFLSLLAVPLCIGNARSSNVFVGIGLSILIVMVYWVVYSMLLNLGKTGLLPPILAAWSPGALSLVLFFILMRRKTY